MNTVYVVRCADQAKRHAGWFVSAEEAAGWAHVAHRCPQDHYVIECTNYGLCPECGDWMLVPLLEDSSAYLHTSPNGESDVHAACCTVCMAIAARYESVQGQS